MNARSVSLPGLAPTDPPAAPAHAASIRLVAIDLDGTLLRTNKRLGVRTIRAIHEATRQGVFIVIASARPPRAVRAIYDKLMLGTCQINYNGALIHDPPRRRHLFHQPLDPQLARRIARFARKVDPDCLVSLEILDKWYTDRVDDHLGTETSRLCNPDFIGPLDAFFTVPVTKLMVLAPPPRIRSLTAKIRRRFGKEVALMLSDHHLLQIVHRQVDKAAALKRVAELYEIPPRQIMAIGDAPNDCGMLRWAGLGVAVDNAWPMVRRAADVIVPSNDDDGVRHALQQYVLH